MGRFPKIRDNLFAQPFGVPQRKLWTWHILFQLQASFRIIPWMRKTTIKATDPHPPEDLRFFEVLTILDKVSCMGHHPRYSPPSRYNLPGYVSPPPPQRLHWQGREGLASWMPELLVQSNRSPPCIKAIGVGVCREQTHQLSTGPCCIYDHLQPFTQRAKCNHGWRSSWGELPAHAIMQWPATFLLPLWGAGQSEGATIESLSVRGKGYPLVRAFTSIMLRVVSSSSTVESSWYTHSLISAERSANPLLVSCAEAQTPMLKTFSLREHHIEWR